MAKDKSKKIISTNKGDSSKKSSTKKIVDTTGSKSGKRKKVTVRSTSNEQTGADKVKETFRSRRASSEAAINQDVLFNRNNYIMIAAAIGMIMLGMLLMRGGDMPDSNTWDESLIYSTRRTLIAPIVILIGLVLGVFSIFRD